MMIMKITLNLSEKIIKEVEDMYNTNSKSEMVENALIDAIRFRKLKQLMNLKGEIEFDEESIDKLRSAEIKETKNLLRIINLIVKI